MRQEIFGFSKCVIIECILVVMIVLATILRKSSLISLLFAFSFIILLVYACSRALSVGIDVLVVALVGFSLANVLVNAIFSGKRTIGFDYYKKAIMFSAFVMMMSYSSEDRITQEAADFILSLPCIAGVLLILSYFVGGNTGKMAGGITLSFTNPNFTGMWLLHISVFFFVMFVSVNRAPMLRIACLVCYAITIWMIVLTKTRSCLIGVVMFLALCAAGKVWGNRVIRTPFVILGITIFPIVVVLVYNSLLNSDWFQNTFLFFSSEGKSLNSRQAVWNPAIRLLKKNILFGDYYGISGGSGMSQLHNTHLDVICSYGLLPFILFLYLLYESVEKTSKKPFCYENYCALCGFLAIIVMGTFEAGVVAGSMGLNLLTTSFLLLANREPRGRL